MICLMRIMQSLATSFAMEMVAEAMFSVSYAHVIDVLAGAPSISSISAGGNGSSRENRAVSGFFYTSDAADGEGSG